ncbi:MULTISPECIES: alpha/beta fold hydrolase [unclassified Enterococcus]|uniref:alpha/beta hydrolase n=1 Tax=unclassified Enterococcus TaxID=2608891 RepID=UPI0013EA6A65|nr:MULTISPECIES: alpha/beta fold hydrolase [unclassified Enterococcus]
MRSLPKPLYAKHGKRAVLLLHAYSGSPNDVRMLCRFLEKADYTVYAPLFTGHGTMEPHDILAQQAVRWWKDTKEALRFLQSEGFTEIAVFGLSMGGIFAVRALEEEQLIGGGFFCSPITPVKTNVPENFEKYVRQVLKLAGKDPEEIEEKAVAFRPLVEQQLTEIQEQAAIAKQNLRTIQTPVFLAQAGQDEMIDPYGVYETARRLSRQKVTLQWYPTSSHVVTVGEARRELERDVLDFLKKLPWNEE